MDSTGKATYWTRFEQARLSRRLMLSGTVGLTGAAALGLAGCGGSSNNSNNNAQPATRVAAPSATAAGTTVASTPARAAATAVPAGSVRAGTPATGVRSAPTASGALKTGGTIQGTFVVANAPLDPVANTTYTAQYLAGFVYSRLMRFNSGSDPSVSLSRETVPDLASGYEQPDPTTYTFHLRPDAMFHPPLSRAATSADVLASYQRATTEPKNSNKDVFAPYVESLTAPDGQTVQFKLKQLHAPFLNKLANPSGYLWILSQDASTGKIDPSQQSVGTGPWLYVNSSPTAYNFKKNPAYFLKGLPYADAVALNVIPTVANQEAQLQAGQIDFLGVPTSDVDTMKKAMSKANVLSYLANGLQFMYFADVGQDSVFKDPRMRQAASLSIDRDGLIDLAYTKQGAWANFINPGLGKWHLNPKSSEAGASAQYFVHDPQKAKQLVAAAGQQNTQITYIYSNNAYGDVFNQIADAVRGMLSDGGFKVNVLTLDYLKDYISTNGVYSKGPPPSAMAYGPQTPFTDPDDYITNMLSTGGGRNNSHVSDPQLDAMIKQEGAELDENKRVQLVHQIQEYQGERMYYVPTVNGNSFIFIQPWTQNYTPADDYAFGTENYAYISVNNR